MRLIVSGKTKDFTPELEEKFTSKIAKLSKLIERRGEREAHVSHQIERHLHKMQVIINFYDHSLVGEGVDADLETAMCQAIEKLEKQIVNLRYPSRCQGGARNQGGLERLGRHYGA
jgi:ribosomal subunit interface protein